MKFFAAALFVALNFYVYNELGSGAEIPERKSFSLFPMQLDGWKCQERGEMDEGVLRTLGAGELRGVPVGRLGRATGAG